MFNVQVAYLLSVWWDMQVAEFVIKMQFMYVIRFVNSMDINVDYLLKAMTAGAPELCGHIPGWFSWKNMWLSLS